MKRKNKIKGKDLEAIFIDVTNIWRIEIRVEKFAKYKMGSMTWKKSLSKIRIDRYNSVHTNLSICDLSQMILKYSKVNLIGPHSSIKIDSEPTRWTGISVGPQLISR